MRSAVVIGRFFSFKFRRNASRNGHYRAARQLRKLGIPILLARLILLGRL